MKTEIKKILYKFLQDGITSDDAARQVLDLFDVVGQSEQLVAFCRWYNQNIPSYEATEEEIVEIYLRESN